VIETMTGEFDFQSLNRPITRSLNEGTGELPWL
jgi:hypothetical protein